MQNRFWLILPVLALDLSLSNQLPRAFQGESFLKDIPQWVTFTENFLRVLVVGMPLLMPLRPLRSTRKVLALYALGLTAYAGSWLAVVFVPTSAWSMSFTGFTAPAWTSIIWLAAIGLQSSVRGVRAYRPWIFLALAALFTAVHTLHAVIVWNRNY